MDMSLPVLLTLVPWVVAVVMLILGTGYSLRKLHRSVLAKALPFPPVSILKPVKGIEPGMEMSIRSFFSLDYPAYEILFSVADAADPACELIRRLMVENPHVPTQLIVGEVVIGPNPKVNNLIHSYQRAAHDHILISDSNVRVQPSYLKRVVSHLDADVGVVTAVVAGTEPRGIGGHLEAAYLNSFYARWMHIADALGRSFVVGKSMLFRRSVADRFGGISALSHYIAEDYAAGQAMQRMGLRVVIMRDPIRQHIGEYDFSAFWSRHLRWGRIRKAQAPAVFLIEPFQFSIISGVFGALAFQRWLGVDPVLFFGVHLGSWAILDLLLIRTMESKLTFRSFSSWLLREILALPLWCHMACGSSINWRGSRLRILPGGLVTEL